MSIVPIGGVDPMEPGGGGAESAELVDRAVVSADRLAETRAEEAERRAGELEARVAELERELASAVASCEAAERRREIDRALVEAGTIDIEAAALLAESVLSRMDEPDAGGAVEELRRSKPYLFARGGGGFGMGSTGSASGRARASTSPTPAAGSGPSGRELVELADEARLSGDRRALLRYLRQRRGV